MKPVAIIIRNVPEQLRRDIKAEAARRGISMSALIIGLMEKFVEGKK